MTNVGYLFSSFTFHRNLIDVWNVLKNIYNINYILSSLENFKSTEPVLIKGSNMFEKNAQFSFVYRNCNHLLFEVKELVESDYFCYIQWNISEQNNMFPCLKCKFIFHYSKENETLFTIEYIFTEKTDSSLTNLYAYDEERQRQLCFYTFELFILQKRFLMTQYETVTLNKSFNDVVKLIRSIQIWETLYSFTSPKDFEESDLEIGTILNLVKTQNSKDKSCSSNDQAKSLMTQALVSAIPITQLIVKHIEQPKKEFTLVFQASEYWKENEVGIKLPSRIIIFKISHVRTNETFVLIRHDFGNQLQPHELEYLSQTKQSAIQKFQQLVKKLENKKKK